VTDFLGTMVEQMTGLVVLGARGHGIDVASIAAAAGLPIVGFLDDDRTIADSLGACSAVELFGAYLIGVNDSATRERLDESAFVSPSAIHPIGSTHHSISAAPGVVVGANTTIGPEVTLGRHTHINGNCFLTRCRLGDYVTVGPGVTICGDVLIGDGAMIGAGATISNLSTIGPWATIGAGAVIPPNVHVPGGETWVGVPARPVTSGFVGEAAGVVA
jgi:acetyltransferase-like isoleucine patch superfamily enzyme